MLRDVKHATKCNTAGLGAPVERRLRACSSIARRPSDGGSMLIQRFLTRTRLWTILPFCAFLLAQAPAMAADAATQVRVTTSTGDFVIELLPDRAPLTVANFLRYVREGF